jgi:hypothetical protein
MLSAAQPSVEDEIRLPQWPGRHGDQLLNQPDAVLFQNLSHFYSVHSEERG